VIRSIIELHCTVYRCWFRIYIQVHGIRLSPKSLHVGGLDQFSGEIAFLCLIFFIQYQFSKTLYVLLKDILMGVVCRSFRLGLLAKSFGFLVLAGCFLILHWVGIPS